MTRRRRSRSRRRTLAEQAEVLASPASPHNDPLVKALYDKLPTATNLEAAQIGLALQRVIRGENLEEDLASPASPHNDPLVKALYDKLPTATNLEAAQIGLALQRVIRGENLEDTNPDAAAAYKEFMANADKTSEAYERDKARFIISSLDDALQLTDKQKAKLNEITGLKYKEIKKKVKTNTHNKKLWMQDQITNGPKVEVYVEPKLQMGRVGDAQTIQMEGIVIGLNEIGRASC